MLCQCPIAGHIISTQQKISAIENFILRVNALLRTISFLQKQEFEEETEQLGVSMPFRGPYHFYSAKNQRDRELYIACQCPIAGQVISTKLFYTNIDHEEFGVNALLRARSFLQEETDSKKDEEPRVNALLRARSFLPATIWRRYNGQNLCQCPIAGQVISTPLS